MRFIWDWRGTNLPFENKDLLKQPAILPDLMFSMATRRYPATKSCSAVNKPWAQWG